jgi:hypothetical protein
VLAAADGTVDNIISDPFAVPGDEPRFNVQLRHPGRAGDYFTAYTNLTGVPSSLVPRAPVSRGQIIGTAGPPPGVPDRNAAMTHFQLNDPSDRTPALSNATAVNPETYFTPSARARLQEIWRTAIYINEWCEPFLGNSRANAFPMSRMWMLKSGDGPAKIEIRCPIDSADAFEYSFLSADGMTLESGRMKIGWNVRPVPPVDFNSSNGSSRLGIYDIVENTLQLVLAPAGVTRPSSFAGEATYTTAK